MLTVLVVPDLAAKECSEQIMKRLAYCQQMQMCIDMQEEMRKVICTVLREYNLTDD